MERHFTATVYIIQDDKVLLLYHRKLQKWLPTGGHIDPNETPVEAAKREALEETGLEIELIRQENVWIENWNAASLERPYLCLLEEVPAYQHVPAHQHIDFIYVGRPKGGSELQNREETDGLRWFTLEEVEQLKPDSEMFAETQEVLRSIFTSFLPLLNEV